MVGISSVFELDPFGFWPGKASCIRGLGGSDLPAEPTIAFHTPYAMPGAGPVMAEIAFDGLTATKGKLVVDILALAPGASDSEVQRRIKLDLAKLADSGGRHRFSFTGREATIYALRGCVPKATDARADRLAISIDRPPDGSVLAGKLTSAREALFGAGKSSDGLVVDCPATLAEPRSQMCTVAQFDEPDYARWLSLMHRPLHRHRKQWEYVYIGRMLEWTGMLKPGFRALGFGCGVEPLPAVFAAHGLAVTASDLPADDERANAWRATNQLSLGLEALCDPAICDPDRFYAQVEMAEIDMTAIPDTRRGYDVCWSSCALEHLGSIQAGLAFIERSLDTLRPGGVAVHTTEFNLTSDDATLTKGATVLFRRRDVEALARHLRAAGHDVAPITFDQGDQPEDFHVDAPPYSADNHFKVALGQYVSASFGLAVRKRG